MKWLTNPIKPPSKYYYLKALNRQAQLTKPPGSLGILEELAIKLAAMQETQTPELERVWVTVFAADHGVAEEGVSAFPQAVTVAMVNNFLQGGAAVNVLTKQLNACFEVVDTGLSQEIDAPELVIDRAGNGTENFCKRPAMTDDQLVIALMAGQKSVIRALQKKSQIYIGGEMGIANTTSASAVACAILNAEPEYLTGAGTGLDAKGIRKKADIIKQALTLHADKLNQPLAVMRHLGGFEIAALVGAYLYSAQQLLPVLIDGFICTVAALVAVRINPDAGAWFIYAHTSHEKGHQRVLASLNARPLLGGMYMRLGEASGALIAVPVLQAACNLHNKMATFEQAQITQQ